MNADEAKKIFNEKKSTDPPHDELVGRFYDRYKEEIKTRVNGGYAFVIFECDIHNDVHYDALKILYYDDGFNMRVGITKEFTWGQVHNVLVYWCDDYELKSEYKSDLSEFKYHFITRNRIPVLHQFKKTKSISDTIRELWNRLIMGL